MIELLNTIIEATKQDKERDIFKPHGEEDVSKLKQDWDKLSDKEQDARLHTVLAEMNPNKLMKLASEDFGIDVEKCVGMGMLMKDFGRGILTQFDTRKLRKELYFKIIGG